MKLLEHSLSLFCKAEAYIFLIRGGYILCACKSVAGLINTPTDSQHNVLQALCIWSQCMLFSTTPLSFLPRFPPTFRTFFLLSRASSILPAPPASYCQHGLFCMALLVSSAFGNIWTSAGSWAQKSVHYPYSQTCVWIRGMDQKTELTVLTQEAENSPGLPEALALKDVRNCQHRSDRCGAITVGSLLSDKVKMSSI